MTRVPASLTEWPPYVLLNLLAGYEWTEGAHDDLRVLALPEEYYCPLEQRSKPDRSFMPAVGRSSSATSWRTSWRRGVYRCRAVHGHGYFPSYGRGRSVGAAESIFY